LHEHAKLYHRDVKAENVLVFTYSENSDQIAIKLCDFGISKRFNERLSLNESSISPPSMIGDDSVHVSQTQTLGTIPWMAPEFLEHKGFTTKSEAYSFGILMYELFLMEPGQTCPYSELQGV
jgi:serine/threonine protein kinase